MAYLNQHDWFGHDRQNIVWIPERYHEPQKLIDSEDWNIPCFPYGSGSWLVLEKSFIKKLESKGVKIIIQTDGCKVGERPDMIKKMLRAFQESSAEWMVAVYGDVDKTYFNSTDWHKRFDMLVNGKGYPKGFAPYHGDAIAGWYLFRIDCLSRLWDLKIRNYIENKARQYPQVRQLCCQNKVIDLKIFEINMPILLEFFQVETFCVSRAEADLGIGLKTIQDIPVCKRLFEKRESENSLRPL